MKVGCKVEWRCAAAGFLNLIQSFMPFGQFLLQNLSTINEAESKLTVRVQSLFNHLDNVLSVTRSCCPIVHHHAPAVHELSLNTKL